MDRGLQEIEWAYLSRGYLSHCTICLIDGAISIGIRPRIGVGDATKGLARNAIQEIAG
jgi:hypothetical protein